MDVINKLYFTVSNTVSQISNALPGNAVTKEFDIYEHIGSAGPGKWSEEVPLTDCDHIDKRIIWFTDVIPIYNRPFMENL